MPPEPTSEEIWQTLLSGQFSWESDRRKYQLLPAKKRCKNCNAPFDGPVAWLARRDGRAQCKRNPRFCNY